MSNSARNRLHSTWTPLSNNEANQKMYAERRALIGKWFDKWSDSQRKQLLSDLIGKSKSRQIEYTGDIINKKRPVRHEDFTRLLPRVLSLYLFSFLDPRSLCRCSRVSWYWKNLTELDHVWMPKCIRLGWILPFSPGPYEQGTWKRLYIENIQALKCITPQVPNGLKEKLELLRLENDVEKYEERNATTPTSARPPWRGSDPTPKDTWRNNYLQNDDEMTKVTKLRKKGYYGQESREMLQRVKNKVQSGMDTAGKRPPSAIQQRVQTPTEQQHFNSSAMKRPDWAKTTHNKTDNDLMKSSVDASQRPAPVSKMKVTRTARDPPSRDLFPDKPWQVPADDAYDSDSY